MLRMTVLGLSAFVFLLVPATAQDDLNALGRKLKRNLASLDAFQAEFEVTEFSGSASAPQKKTTKRRQDWARSGRLVKFRIENESEATIETFDGKKTVPFRQTIVRDGKYVWVHEQKGSKEDVVKNVAEHVGNLDPINEERRRYKITQSPDEALLGRNCHLIVYEGKRDSRLAGYERKVWFDEKTGVPLKSELRSPSGRLMRREAMTNFQPGHQADFETFVFQAPKGVQVTDATSPSFRKRGVLTKKSKLSTNKPKSSKRRKKAAG